MFLLCSVAVVPLTRFGTVPEDTPVFTYHCPDAYATQINELNFSPHDDFQLATAGNDGGAAIWRIPSEDGLSQDITQVFLHSQIKLSRYSCY